MALRVATTRIAAAAAAAGALPSTLPFSSQVAALIHLVDLVGLRPNRPRLASSRTNPEDPETPSSKPEKKLKLADRLSAVIDVVNDRKLPPELRGQRNNVRSETDIINVVEQRIWHSMEEGQFENLPGKGKPLNLSSNPHADPAEDTLYRILSKNGCAPEWVELNKEIRGRINEWRLALKKAQANRLNENCAKWIEDSEVLKVQLREINDKMFGLKWEKELDRLNG
ncbi:uncharacterized protein LOC122094741 isoform X2 [Macadamia integrifolia]|uniref:uncharacterized protein LOC122094741 isoform X2 n=1 Tax=Macadamia integrifolia TaxID=60698 RepID=UPI001C4FD68C|nr:uncharacterized protein LOC122094741 isoform X2 [Macadamia integrifolia]